MHTWSKRNVHKPVSTSPQTSALFFFFFFTCDTQRPVNCDFIDEHHEKGADEFMVWGDVAHGKTMEP